MNIDQAEINSGNLNFGLRFGSYSNEGIASKRTAGGNQYGLDFYTNNANRLAINANGNVGIGTTTPSQKLTIQGGNLRMVGNGNDTISSWTNLTLRANDDNSGAESLNFAVGNAERMRINTSGNVGIGTTDPTVTLDVVGDIKYSGNLDMGIVRVLKTQEVGPNTGTVVACSCPANTKLIGGGGGHTLPNADMDDILMPYNGPKPDSPDTTWTIYIRNYGTTIHYLSIYAICAKVK